MITLYKNGVELPFKQWEFPGGEIGVQLSDIDNDCGILYSVQMDYENSDDVFVFLNVCDALGECGIHIKNVLGDIPYFPYARQDRVCNKGESKALEVFIQAISKAYCDVIYTKDMHSKETMDLCETYGIGLVNKNQDNCAGDLPLFDVLIAPDKGAENKAKEHEQVQKGAELICLSKTRVDSKVVYVDYAYDTIKGNICVVDDLVDGGFTFLSLAEMLKRTQPNITSLNLYVTHGLFSKGTNELKKFYDRIYVHNLMNKSVLDSVVVI